MKSNWLSSDIWSDTVSNELDRHSTVAKNATVEMEDDCKIKQDIEYYNLGVIISVG